MSKTVRLVRVDTWLTRETASADGWSTIKPFLFVRLVSNVGAVGWGEAFTLPCRERGVASMIHTLGARVMAEGLVAPSEFRRLAAQIADKHRGMDYAAATSAVEIALWDLQGRLERKPLYELLGRRLRSAVPVYANTWSDARPDAAALAGRAEALAETGFDAVKFYPLQGRSPAEGAACMSAIRSRLGNDAKLMLDLASPDDPVVSRRLAPLVAPHAPYWFEEPCDGELIFELASIREETGLRVVTGEKQCGVPHFRNVVRLHAADVLNPDIAGVGGVLDMLEIAEAAGAAGVDMSPHCWNSTTIAAAAMLHVCSVLPNADHAELYPDYAAFGERFADCGFTIANGEARLSGAPGLGVDIDVGALSSLARHEATEA